MVIDFTNGGELAGLEVFNASENISMYTDVSLDEARGVLENIEDLSLESKARQGMLSIGWDYKELELPMHFSEQVRELSLIAKLI